MKLWIGVDEDYFVTAFSDRPRFIRRRRFGFGKWFDDSGLYLCDDSVRILKALLNLDDWPGPGQCLEYDINKEEGWIWDG